MKQALGNWALREERIRGFSMRSILLNTVIWGLSLAPSSSMTFRVVLMW